MCPIYQPMETNDHSAGQLQAMSLLASLRTAVEVCQALALRRAGRDPSQQEDRAPARAHLREARQELMELTMRLRISTIIERGEATALVQAFEDRMLMAQAARSLHLVHQRLLSLYPEVPEGLVEQSRRLQAEAARLAAAEDETLEPAIAAWCDASAGFLGDLASALSTAN